MKKKIYKQPEVRVLHCRIEQGFAGSGYITEETTNRHGWGWGDKNHTHDGSNGRQWQKGGLD